MMIMCTVDFLNAVILVLKGIFLYFIFCFGLFIWGFYVALQKQNKKKQKKKTPNLIYLQPLKNRCGSADLV